MVDAIDKHSNAHGDSANSGLPQSSDVRVTPPSPDAHSDVALFPSIADIPLIVRRRWKLFVVGALVASLIAVLFVRLSAPIYTAQILLTTKEEAGSGIQLGGNFSQVAGLLGVGDQGSASISEFIAAMQSRQVARTLFENEDILALMFPRQWDGESKSWVDDPRLVASLKRGVKQVLLGAQPRQPTPDSIVTHISKNVTIGYPADSPGLVQIQYIGQDSQSALYFLTELIKQTEKQLLEQYQETTKASLAYASEMLSKEVSNPVREALQTVIAREMQQLVSLGSGRLQSVRFILSPEVNIVPVKPSLVVSLLLFNLLAFLCLLFFLLIRHVKKQRAPL